ncbi:hypothetical protein MCBMB27_05282 [Methylobacterium phyllosphaerae]|uniref:Uncharacterized protein n=1 Tax=Methylobacterium phyllosphaerae TaxID=418223 RepID=A0AAE8L7L7_9HYPH|nr:hypothetical protein MCBMB27_05282 [Methylobacterium phyllosphaerae]SFH18959.1 hypothetical protein SAMN05192567_11615 [Methylobacterium phyllosphaerae]
MTVSWLGVLITFQVTFTELFIAASVIVAAAYRFGWRSVALGSVLGAVGIGLLAAVLQIASYAIALHWLDWISALLLLGFGAYLAYEFISGFRGATEPVAVGNAWALPLNVAGTRYSRDQSFAVLGRNRSFLLTMAVGSIIGTFVGGHLLGLVPTTILLPMLAAILLISAFKVWNHA